MSNRSFIRLYSAGIGIRIGRRYWHMRRNPHGLWSERSGAVRFWQVGRWRLTYRIDGATA